MALPLDKLGTTHGSTTTVVDLDRVRACSAAAGQGAVVIRPGLAEVV